MALRKQQTLHDLHAQADRVASAALNVFHSVVDDLHRAALAHEQVADDAQAQIDNLTALRDAAKVAADQRTKQAEAVANLVG
jgi:hypothetical protein